MSATLVIHPGALGDVLQAIPALTALRELGGGTAPTFAGQSHLGTLLAGTGVVGSCPSFDGLGLEALFGRDPVPADVRRRLAGFARVISWFGARADPFPARLRELGREVVVASPVPPPESPLRVWEHLVETVTPSGVTTPPPLLPLRLPDAWRAEGRRALSRLGVDAGRPFLVVHPGAGGADKRWSAGGFAQAIRGVVQETRCQVVVHEGPADKAAAGELLANPDLPALRLREPALPVLAAILQEAAAYLGGDTGVSHLAAAVGSQAVILFPPASWPRWAPWSHTALPLTMPDSSGTIAPVVRALIERVSGVAAKG
jgi:heptosyltransferase-3